MSHDSRGNEPDQVNNGALAVVLGIVALATLAVALVVTALVRDEVGAMKALRDLKQDREYRDLKAEQVGKLEGTARWVDKAKGVVAIPIARAMALTLEDVRRNPSKLSPWFVGPAPETVPAEGAAPEGATAPAEGAPAVDPAAAPAVDASGAPTAPVAPPASPEGTTPAKATAAPSANPAPVAPVQPAPVTPKKPAAPAKAPAATSPAPAPAAPAPAPAPPTPPAGQ